jgi:hypothetical protein
MSSRINWRAWLAGNGLLLVLPALAFNLLFASHLPAAYKSDLIWNDIPDTIAVPETVLRLFVFVLPALMMVRGKAHVQPKALALFVFGSALYFASWLVLIAYPDGSWARSGVGFLAPAYTPALWLAGLAMLMHNFVIPQRWYRRWMYGLVSAAFLGFHNAHAILVFSRLP